MRKLGLLLILLIGCYLLSGQNNFNQFISVDVKQAYRKGTRSMTGAPGPNYWQNHSKYNIIASVNTDENMLNGEETVIYFNDSPDTLKKIILRLYPDILKKGNARDWPLGADAVNEGMQIDELKINDSDIDLADNKVVKRTITNLQIDLSELLLPGDSLRLETKWKFEIPTRTVRMGDYGDNRYFIAYWYPQIAVYDDIDGWDLVEYLGTVEFYNDFNDYDVRINTKDGFLLWGTGTLINPAEIFRKDIVKKIGKAHESREVVKIFTVDDCRSERVLINSENNQWHLIAKHVPDFSFALADEANWDGSSVVVDSVSGREVFADAVYAKDFRTYQNAGNWSRNVLEYMSFELPGFPYPYEHMTSFSNGNKGGGMESPMMANNGDPENIPDSDATLFHEASHSYFPFFMGTNERKYAWMDEGWAAFLTIGYLEKYHPEFPYLQYRVPGFESINGTEKESTLMTLSYNIVDYGSYRMHAYNRPAFAYLYLQEVLGDSLFKVSLLSYMNQWNGKHPIPYDFFNCFMQASGQNLLWFFEPWFFEKAYADLGIKKVTGDNLIVVENYGGLPLPVEISCLFEDGSAEDYYGNPLVWSSGDPAVIIEANPAKKIKMVLLGSDIIPDVNKLNNVFELE